MEQEKAVYIVDPNGIVQRREVSLGIFKGDLVQIDNGLRGGELLIVNGYRFVGPGQKVNIVGGID